MSHHCAGNWRKFKRESKLTNDKDLKSQLGQIHSCVSINLRRDVSPSFGPGICRSWITSSNCTDAVVYLPSGRKQNLNWDLELLVLLYISELFYRLLIFDYRIKRGKKTSSPKISFQMTARFCVYFIEIDLLYKSIYMWSICDYISIGNQIKFWTLQHGTVDIGECISRFNTNT